ncbi:hypothetical protein CHH83_24295 [Bacillus sp. 7586-K]|nr:hypothetical protein CHH83_24295 [Bacillus sp. 7586-K]
MVLSNNGGKFNKKRKAKWPVLLLTSVLCIQGATTTFAANVVDDSAIEPKAAAYGYYVDAYQNNSKDNMTPESNPAIGVLSKFHELWTPGTSWDNGTVLNAQVHNHNIDTVISITNNRTEEEAAAAYLDDRRHQSYSDISGLGNYSDKFKEGANAGTTISDDIPEDATSVKYEDGGNPNGNWADEDSSLGSMVKLVNTLRGSAATTNPAKSYYNYMRPFRWSDEVSLVPALVPAKKDDPTSDGGFPSGHTNAAYLAAYALAYSVPEKYEELMTRASELGNSRIVAGMHSPLDVIGGRVMATATAAAVLNDPANASLKEAAYQQAHDVLLTQEGTSENYEANKEKFTERLTYGFEQIGDTTKPMIVPKGAEVLLESRFPYLDATQRRWILYTTGLPSGYPVLDDAEGWGRLNLFTAAGGYEAFETDVTVTMDAAQGGFNASDSWKNDIAGPGKLTKLGTGTLTLTGDNSYSGGTVIEEGSIVADSSTALGQGEVINNGGTLNEDVTSSLNIGDDFTQAEAGTLELTIGNSEEVLAIDGEATFGGTLNLNFVDGYVPNEDSAIITYATLAKGSTFSSVEINGLPDTYDVVYDEQALRVVDTTKEEPDQDKDTDKDTDKETDKDVDNGTETDNGTENEKDTDDVPNVPVESEDDKNKKDNKNHTDVDYPTYEASKQSETSKQINADDSTKKEIDTVKNPKTGDDTNLIPYVVLLVGSVLTAGFVLFRRKLKRVDN